MEGEPSIIGGGKGAKKGELDRTRGGREGGSEEEQVSPH